MDERRLTGSLAAAITALEEWCTDLEITRLSRSSGWLREGEKFSALGRLVHLNLVRCGLEWELIEDQPAGGYREVYQCGGGVILLPQQIQELTTLTPGGSISISGETKTVTYMNDRNYPWGEIAALVRHYIIRPLEYDLEQLTRKPLTTKRS